MKRLVLFAVLLTPFSAVTAQLPTPGTVWGYRMLSDTLRGFRDSVVASRPGHLTLDRRYHALPTSRPIPVYCAGVWVRPFDQDFQGDFPMVLPDGGSRAVFRRGDEWQSRLLGSTYTYYVEADTTVQTQTRAGTFETYKVRARLDSTARNDERWWLLAVAPGFGTVRVQNDPGNDNECDFELSYVVPVVHHTIRSAVIKRKLPGHISYDVVRLYPTGTSRDVATSYLGIGIETGRGISENLDLRARLVEAAAEFDTTHLYIGVDLKDSTGRVDSSKVFRGPPITLLFTSIELGSHWQIRDVGLVLVSAGITAQARSFLHHTALIGAPIGSVTYRTLPLFYTTGLEVTYFWGARLPTMDGRGQRFDAGMGGWSIGLAVPFGN